MNLYIAKYFFQMHVVARLKKKMKSAQEDIVLLVSKKLEELAVSNIFV